MNDQEPLVRLADFYKSLDAIPTPRLAMKPPSRRGWWIFAFAPIGASLTACLAMWLCASAPANPRAVLPPRPAFDSYVLDETRPAPPAPKATGHALSESDLRRPA